MPLALLCLGFVSEPSAGDWKTSVNCFLCETCRESPATIPLSASSRGGDMETRRAAEGFPGKHGMQAGGVFGNLKGHKC